MTPPQEEGGCYKTAASLHNHQYTQRSVAIPRPSSEIDGLSCQLSGDSLGGADLMLLEGVHAPDMEAVCDNSSVQETRGERTCVQVLVRVT